MEALISDLHPVPPGDSPAMRATRWGQSQAGRSRSQGVQTPLQLSPHGLPLLEKLEPSASKTSAKCPQQSLEGFPIQAMMTSQIFRRFIRFDAAEVLLASARRCPEIAIVKGFIHQRLSQRYGHPKSRCGTFYCCLKQAINLPGPGGAARAAEVIPG